MNFLRLSWTSRKLQRLASANRLVPCLPSAMNGSTTCVHHPAAALQIGNTWQPPSCAADLSEPPRREAAWVTEPISITAGRSACVHYTQHRMVWKGSGRKRRAGRDSNRARAGYKSEVVSHCCAPFSFYVATV
jgi:hypothetical protein